MIVELGLVVAAYALGATPSSYWLGKAVYGVDLRTRGSGNLGATNAFRVLGARAAAPALAVDVLKGWAPVALFPLATPEADFGWRLGYGAAAILGHAFSFWVGFRGGKGVATSAGVFLAIAPWAVLIALGLWVSALLATGYVSVGSILAALALPLLVALTPHEGGAFVVVFTAALGAFVIWAHRGNLRRLARGEESRFRRSDEGGSAGRGSAGRGSAGRGSAGKGSAGKGSAGEGTEGGGTA